MWSDGYLQRWRSFKRLLHDNWHKKLKADIAIMTILAQIIDLLTRMDSLFEKIRGNGDWSGKQNRAPEKKGAGNGRRKDDGHSVFSKDK